MNLKPSSFFLEIQSNSFLFLLDPELIMPFFSILVRHFFLFKQFSLS